jgi:hypothetical protein
VLLPAIQYGDWPTVKRRMSKVVTQLKRGAGLIEVMTQDGMLDTAETPGLIVMIRSILGPVSNFHCFAPWRQAEDPLHDQRTDPTVPAAAEEAVFVASLQTPWGILGLLSSDNQTWLIRRERHQPFLNATLMFWNELDAIGPRYYEAGQAERLWKLPTNLRYVLANMGVPNDILNSPLPPGGPRALLPYARPAAQA